MAEKFKNKIKVLMRGAGNNKKGFTLTELIVCVAILGILAISTGVMMSSGSNMFTKLNKRVNVSYKTQIAMTQIKEFFVDCDGVCKDEEGNVYILNSEEVYSFVYDDPADEVRMKVYSADMTQTSDEPFAKQISSFNIEIIPTSNGSNAKIAKINMVSSINNIASRESQVISLKNSPILITEADADAGKTAIDKFKEKIGG